VEGVDDVGEAEADRASVSCAASRSPRLRDRQASRNWLPADVLWRDQRGGTVQVMRVTYHKLVRDQIPGIIAADGGQPVIRVLEHAGYEAALRAKLLEEAHEAQAAPDGQLVSELADVLEVLQALAAVHDVGWGEVVSEASRKRAERGGFDHRIFLEYVDQAR
jgi:predicted house-cleaning noncanonical NTP pyrophosphatase (MazG superfamily)